MENAKQPQIEQPLIRNLTSQSVQIGEQVWPHAVIVSRRGVEHDFRINTLDELDHAALEKLQAYQPEILLIGTGARQIFLAPKLFANCINAQIGYEVMHSRAAAQTFNILLSEGRNVLLVLLLPSDDNAA